MSGPLTYTPGRNPDIADVVLEVDGKVVLRFAKAYGFRNISSIVTKLKRKRSPYHFVEIMACPGGCVNGGGQVKLEAGEDGTPVTPAQSRELVGTVSDLLHDRATRAPSAAPVSAAVYDSLLGGAPPASAAARAVFHTAYHAVAKLPDEVMALKW